jgi:glutathione synthase
MLHQTAPSEEYALKQVELNTIASSFAGLASTVAKLHRFLTQRMESDGRLNEFLQENHKCVTPSGRSTTGGVDGVPESPSMTQLPLAMSIAHERYCQRYMRGQDSSSVNFRPTVLFVVQPNETNTVDQRLFEFALWKNHQIPVVRMSLSEIFDKTKLDEDTGRLVIKSDHGATQEEVTVVYFRAGYAPSDYPSGYNTDNGSGVEWLARERLERSRSTKCPCLGYHLAGTKKVQQELARGGAVERFFPENVDNTAQQIRTVFAGLYSLGADATEQDIHAVRDVLFQGGEGRYVLKPQREGGGYNYYGKNLADKLRENCTIVENSIDEEKDVRLAVALSEFILMERLFPPQQRAILLRNGQVEGTGMTISELGCFGAIVTTKDSEIVHNDYGGFLLRTKFSGVDEGGVASGFATLSSPYLC